MIVRIRFGRGRLITDRRGKNVRAARLLASLLTLISVACAVFGIWRLGQDLGFAGDFVFTSGLLSHWQVWFAAFAATQYGRWRLSRYSKLNRPATDETGDEEEPAEKVTARI